MGGGGAGGGGRTWPLAACVYPEDGGRYEGPPRAACAYIIGGAGTTTARTCWRGGLGARGGAPGMEPCRERTIGGGTGLLAARLEMYVCWRSTVEVTPLRLRISKSLRSRRCSFQRSSNCEGGTSGEWSEGVRDGQGNGSARRERKGTGAEGRSTASIRRPRAHLHPRTVWCAGVVGKTLPFFPTQASGLIRGESAHGRRRRPTLWRVPRLCRISTGRLEPAAPGPAHKNPSDANCCAAMTNNL